VEHRRTLRDGERRLSDPGGTFEANDGAGPPEQRLREQDLDGVDAEVLFVGVDGGPNFLRRGIKDDEAYLAVIRAYNDWLAEEYCAVDPDRLIGLGLIPEVDAQSAVAEMEHCARLGLRGVQLNTFPSGTMLPTPEDDIFWAAALDLEMALTVHECFRNEAGANPYDGPLFQYPKSPQGEVPSTTLRDPLRKMATGYGYKPAASAMQFIFSGVFDQFPSLQIYFAETQIGWLPMWLQEVDETYARSNRVHQLYGLPALERLPSEYIKDHFMWGFMKDPFGVRQRHEIGVERVMWETDFPHVGTDWPHSQNTIDKNFVDVPENERHQMLVGNAVKFFHLDDA
jgi:predicted TIM-barrel fold metal-dependent hydrolase